MTINYEIKKKYLLKIFLKDFFGIRVRYFKIKNNTNKTLTIYRAVKSTQIAQDYTRLGQKLNSSTDTTITLDTTVRYKQIFEKIVLEPYQKKKITYEQYLPLYWIEENTIYPIKYFPLGSKIIFNQTEESIEEIVNKTVDNILQEIIKDTEQQTDYKTDMNKIHNNLNDINELLNGLNEKSIIQEI